MRGVYVGNHLNVTFLFFGFARDYHESHLNVKGAFASQIVPGSLQNLG